VLYIKKKLLEKLTPWHLGGNIVDQVHRDHFTLQPGPARIEAGTPAIEAVIGWGAAINYLAALGLENVQQHEHALVEYALSRLSDIRNVHIVGPTDATVRGVGVLFYIDGLEAHGVARMLSNRSNVLVRSGYHCAQPLHEALDVLPTVRASFYVYNTTQDIDELAKGLEAIVSLL
jgi:cysteine desulfurase/selenocysteine lyase